MVIESWFLNKLKKGIKSSVVQKGYGTLSFILLTSKGGQFTYTCIYTLGQKKMCIDFRSDFEKVIIVLN